MINSQDAEAIRTVNKNLEARNGSQIVVATFDFLDGEAIDDVAYDLFNGWKIGSADDNNGVLLVLAIGEEDYYCLQGNGLEKTLPTSDIQTILDSTLEPEFAAGNYSSGALKTVQALAQRLEKTAGTPVLDPSQSQGGGGSAPHSAQSAFSLFAMIPSIFFMIFVFVIVIVVLSVFTPRRRHYYGGPGVPSASAALLWSAPAPDGSLGTGTPSRANRVRRIVPIPQPAVPSAGDLLPGLPALAALSAGA